jgi:hypothetical protein
MAAQSPTSNAHRLPDRIDAHPPEGMTLLGPNLQHAHRRLKATMGAAEANRIFRSCLEETHLADLSSPEAQIAFADSLCRRGGFIEVVGRVIKVRALLGTMTPPASSGERRPGSS